MMPPSATSPLCAYMQGLLGQQQNKEIAIVVLDSAKAPCSTLLSLLADRPNPLMTGGHSSMPTLGKNNKKQARKVRFEPSSRGTYTPLDAVKRSSSDPTIVGASRWEHKQCCASRTSPTGLKAANAKWDTFIEKPRRRLSLRGKAARTLEKPRTLSGIHSVRFHKAIRSYSSFLITSPHWHWYNRTSPVWRTLTKTPPPPPPQFCPLFHLFFRRCPADARQWTNLACTLFKAIVDTGTCLRYDL